MIFAPQSFRLALPWQLLPHLADLGPGIILDALFQIEHGKFVAAFGAGEPLQASGVDTGAPARARVE